MDNFTAVGLAEGFIDGAEDEILEAWQHVAGTVLTLSLPKEAS